MGVDPALIDLAQSTPPQEFRVLTTGEIPAVPPFKL